MKRRVLTVGLAVLLAVLGTVGVLAYVNQADARALAGQRAVGVLVADRPIPAGTTAGVARDTGLLHAEVLPASSVTPDALAAVGPDLADLVTNADIPAGQLLLRPMLIPAAQAAGGLAIPAGMVAVSLQLCVQQGVAGYVHAGSRVAVTDTVVGGDVPVTAQAGCNGPHTQQFGAGAVTTVVLPEVKVLAVGAVAPAPAAGSTAAPAAPAATDGVLLTVALNLTDAQRLIRLTQTGLPYLVLLNEPS